MKDLQNSPPVSDSRPKDTEASTKLVRKRTRSAAAKKTASARGAAWTFPKSPLEEALKVPKAIEEQNAGNPMKADMLVKAVGFKKPSDWRFQDLLRSANQYGLVSGTGATASVKFEQIGQDVVAPGSAQQRQKALLSAFRNVEDFRKVEEFYRGKKLPEDEFFENTLVREFAIPRERVKAFIDVFTRNLEYLKAFQAEPVDTADLTHTTDTASGAKKLTAKAEESRTRTFLDTCFVMMPFGEWFDRYYRDIFVPAIREAGLEPVRADELFSTGSVIEQIWEQIEKSKILLADLTGKNANVFYELGLAHAALKPVVFTAGALEDVPFDLRHLRVVIYDVRDPFWGQKLTESLTTYLKNAKSDPEKSIPQPFREIVKRNKEG